MERPYTGIQFFVLNKEKTKIAVAYDPRSTVQDFTNLLQSLQESFGGNAHISFPYNIPRFAGGYEGPVLILETEAHKVAKFEKDNHLRMYQWKRDLPTDREPRDLDVSKAPFCDEQPDFKL